MAGNDITLKHELPQAEYMYGCTATSVGMLLGYYDMYGCSVNGSLYSFSNVVPGTVSVNSRGSDDGNKFDMKDSSVLANFIASEGYIERFIDKTPEEELPYTFAGGDPANGLNFDAFDCLADYLGTGQIYRGNPDFSTTCYLSPLAYLLTTSHMLTVPADASGAPFDIPIRYADFKYGLYKWIEKAGYALDTQKTCSIATTDFTFADFMAEIDAGRPVLVSMRSGNSGHGHMVTAYGYNAATEEILFDDTYDSNCRMTWNGVYRYADEDLQMELVTTVVFDVTCQDSMYQAGAWMQDYELALQCAQACDLPVFLYYGDKNSCPDCAFLENEVFLSAEFQNRADDGGFVLLKNPANRPGAPGPSETPACFLLDSNGKELFRRAGFASGSAPAWMDWFNDSLLLATDKTPPSAPAGLSFQMDSTALVVSWKPSDDGQSGVKGYRIEFSPTEDFSAVSASFSAPEGKTSLTAWSLSAGNYFCRAYAADRAGNLSVWDGSACVVSIDLPFEGRQDIAGRQEIAKDEEKDLTKGIFQNLSGALDGAAVYNEGRTTGNNLYFSGNSVAAESASGGALCNHGSADWNGITFTGNSARGENASGGALANEGVMTWRTAIFNGNSSGGRGGAVYNAGSFTLSDASFGGNTVHGDASASGGAIDNGGTLTLSGATFRENSAAYCGGALYNRGTANLSSITFSGNSAKTGGAICNEGTMTLASAVFSTASDTLYNAENGTIRLSGANHFSAEIVNFGKIEFELGGLDAVVDNLALFSGTGSYAISLDSGLADGAYRMADRTGNFTGTFFLTLDGADTGSCFTLSDGRTDSSVLLRAGNTVCRLGVDPATDSLILLKSVPLPELPEPAEILSTPEELAWSPFTSPPEEEYLFEISPDPFFSATLTLRTGSTGFDLKNLPAGSYLWRVRDKKTGTYSSQKGESLAVEPGGPESRSASDKDGTPDVFFAGKSGVWSDSFHAHNDQTGKIARIAGKNRFYNVFSGSVSDANILYLTDDANGDALFQDDMYSAGAGAVRLDNIREIRAGAGGDVVDFTSDWLASGFSGTIIRGGDGDDTIWADGTDAKLFGDDGNDTLRGGAGNDLIAGGAGDDNLSGGGSSDVFAFGKDWGHDTIAWNPADGGSLTLVFEDGITLNTWDASATSLTAGENSITFEGFTASDVTIRVGMEELGEDEYAKLSACGAFLGSTTQKVYEAPEFQGIIASL